MREPSIVYSAERGATIVPNAPVPWPDVHGDGRSSQQFTTNSVWPAHLHTLTCTFILYRSILKDAKSSSEA
jgi:hypothetical protein